jgi:hypothetical protein
MDKEAGYYQLKNEWEQVILNENGAHSESVIPAKAGI